MEKLSAGEPLTAVRVNFSVALSCAVALSAGRLTHEELAPDWLAARDDDLRDLATRVFLEHDWDLTAATLQGVGGSPRDIPFRRLPEILRRLRSTGMDDLSLGLGDLREGAKRLPPPSWRVEATPGPGQPRMTFPCHVAIRLRTGGVLETDGRERGGSQTPLEEQQRVVDEKFDAVRDTAQI